MWSTSNERRKYRKVIVERRRRERIDRCLEQLRVLVQPATGQPPHLNPDSSSSSSSSNKLEKADILELTVEYLRTISTETASSRATQGYLACLREVDSFLRNAERLTPACTLGDNGPATPSSDRIRRLRTELVSRLSSHIGAVPEVTSVSLTPVSSSPPTSRRVLADRNCRPVAPPASAVSTTSATHCDVTRGLPCRHASSSSSSRAELTSNSVPSGVPNVVGRDRLSTSSRHRRPGPYSFLCRNSSDTMAKLFSCSSAMGGDANASISVHRSTSSSTSSPCAWPSASHLMRLSNENIDHDENSIGLRRHQLDAGSDSEAYENELNDGDMSESTMWRPW